MIQEVLLTERAVMMEWAGEMYFWSLVEPEDIWQALSIFIERVKKENAKMARLRRERYLLTWHSPPEFGLLVVVSIAAYVLNRPIETELARLISVLKATDDGEFSALVIVGAGVCGTNAEPESERT